jgi:hypothetical protein
MSGLTSGPYGIIAEGSVTLVCDQGSETEFALTNAHLITEITEKSDQILATSTDSTFLRVVSAALDAGLDIDSRTINDEGRHEYLFVLRRKWEVETEAFIRAAVAAGMGVKSGFEDSSHSLYWFFMSDFGSRTIREDGYSY